jgi:hypothetical protein
VLEATPECHKVKAAKATPKDVMARTYRKMVRQTARVREEKQVACDALGWLNSKNSANKKNANHLSLTQPPCGKRI